MFFDFSSFGWLAYFLMGLYFYHHVLRPYFKQRRRRRRFKSSLPPPHSNPGRYPPEFKIHRNTGVVREFFREQNKKYIAEQHYSLTGDYIRTNRGFREVYTNSAVYFVAGCAFFGMVSDYEGMKDGSASIDPLDVNLNAGSIISYETFPEKEAYCLRLRIEDPDFPDDIDYPHEMLFKFYGPDAKEMAENAAYRFKNEMLKAKYIKKCESVF